MTLLVTVKSSPEIEAHLQRNPRVLSFADGSRNLRVQIDTKVPISVSVACEAEQLALPLSLSVGPHR
jgi:hypothetical protein